MKKLAVGFATLALACMGGAFADEELTFKNKVSSDVFHFWHLQDTKYDDDGSKSDGNELDFAGISEKMSVEFKSDRVDFSVEAEFTLDDFADDDNFGYYGQDHDYKHQSPYKGVYGIQWTDLDWYIEFRPIEMITLGLHDDVYIDGSYLPVWDDNVSSGNMGSEGFTVIGRPIEGLRLAATIPFGDTLNTTNWLNSKKDDNGDRGYAKFNFGVGADYNYQDKLSVGVSIRDIPNDTDGGTLYQNPYARNFGIYGSIFAVEGATINVGFTHAEKVDGNASGVLEDVALFNLGNVMDISYESLLTAGITYDIDDISVAFDLAYNFDKKLSIYDLYLGFSASKPLDDQLTVAGKLIYLRDMGGNKDTNPDNEDYAAVIGVEPTLTFRLDEHNTFEAGVDLQYNAGDFWIGIPLAWKYQL